MNRTRDISVLWKRSGWAIAVFSILILFQVRFGIIPGWSMQSDFPNYYTSSKLLIEGEETDSLYHNDWFKSKMAGYGFSQEGKFTPFPPPTVFLFAPVAFFEPLVAKRVWLILNLFLAAGIVWLTSRFTGLGKIPVLLVILLAGIGLANNFYLGQVYLLMLFLVTWALVLEKEKKEFLSGFILGICAAVKYFPVIFILPSVIGRKTKAVMGFITGLGVINLLAFIVLKEKVYSDFFTVLAGHLQGNIEGQSPFSFQFQSWNAWLMSLFVYDPVNNPGPLIDSMTLFNILKYLIPALIISSACYPVFKRPGFNSNDFLILLPVAILASLPASATYHYLFMIIPVAFLIQKYRRHKKIVFLVLAGFGCIGFIPPVLDMLYNQINVPVIFKFHRLYLVAGFYFFVFYLMRKNRINI